MVRNNTFTFSWINSTGLTSNQQAISTVVNADFSHGAMNSCLMRYTTRAGLNFVQCRGCGASAIINTAGRGSIKLACLAQQPTQPEPVVTPFPTRARRA
jgi:hypothetical protein